MTEPSDWTTPGPPGQQYPTSQYPAPQYPTSQYPPQQWGLPEVKPGVIPLRPLGLGEILDGAITYIRTNPVPTLGLAAVITTVVQVIRVPVTLLTTGPLFAVLRSPDLGRGDTDRIVAPIAAGIGGSGVGGLLGFVGTTVLTGILMVVLSQAVLGRRMTIGEAWAVARRRLLGLFGVTLLLVLALLAVLVVAAVPAVLAAVLGGGVALTVILAVLGFLLAMVAYVYLWVSWSLVAPVYVLEGGRAVASFRRSRTLVRPQWWRVFGILVLGTIIATIIAAVLAVPFSIAAGTLNGLSSDPLAGLRPSALILTAIGTILASTIVAPFTAGVTGLLYFDQRMRREGLDITLQRAVQR